MAKYIYIIINGKILRKKITPKGRKTPQNPKEKAGTLKRINQQHLQGTKNKRVTRRPPREGRGDTTTPSPKATPGTPTTTQPY
jgi:hypothetical protein